MKTRAFSLIEVMLVLVILATLFALLLPTLAVAREAGKKAVCIGHEKEIGLAMVMYASDFDDVFPAVANGYEQLSDGVFHEISWIDVIQPYAERIANLNDRGKSIFDLNSVHGKTELFVCPSQVADPRASVDYLGNPRLSSGGIGVSFALLPYAYTPRSQSDFTNIAGTILSAEQYLNFSSTYYYPVDWDGVPGTAQYGVNESGTNDCRFDRGLPCTFAAGSFPARPVAMPGMSGKWISNLASWHGGPLNLLFADAHVHFTQRGQTYRVDGSFSAWTLSNRWKWATP